MCTSDTQYSIPHVVGLLCSAAVRELGSVRVHTWYCISHDGSLSQGKWTRACSRNVRNVHISFLAMPRRDHFRMQMRNLYLGHLLAAYIGTRLPSARSHPISYHRHTHTYTLILSYMFLNHELPLLLTAWMTRNCIPSVLFKHPLSPSLYSAHLPALFSE